ncbi:DUF4192 domain-containing protein [Aeromicrobium sp. CTD01-1L150]|uniref:DUF4192 domain-containing protein n=1 Tax=Aeromicrobium sp. CTD01-1L150 TaxID=3341830 RepID=UPI0035C21577
MTSSSLFTAHDVPDLIAALPTCFGFVPQESLCAISTSGPRNRFGFSVRVDLPEEDHVEQVADHVAMHLQRQGAEGAIIVAVSERPELAGRAVWALERALDPVLPVVSAWATEERYWTTFDDCDPRGHPYEPSPHHLAVVQAVAAGQQILPDRASLERRYLPERSARREWIARSLDAMTLEVASRMHQSEVPAEELGRLDVEPILEGALLGRTPCEGDVLRLALWMSTVSVRDFAWRWINRETARDMLTLWAHVARLAPPGLEPGPLCLAAVSAYVQGDGAQALIAAERAQGLDPDYALAGLIVQCLQAGVHPEQMDTMGADVQAYLNDPEDHRGHSIGT